METNSLASNPLATNPIGADSLATNIVQPIPCPYCRSIHTEFFSLFGRQLLTTQYYCNHCHTPFEHISTS